MRVKPKKVDQFAYNVDFRLMCCLGLVEHGCRDHGKTVFVSQQFGCFSKDGYPIGDRCGRPLFPCPFSSVGGPLDFLGTGLVKGGQQPTMIVWAADVTHSTGSDLAAANDQGYLNVVPGPMAERLLQSLPLDAARPVVKDRLVERGRKFTLHVEHSHLPTELEVDPCDLQMHHPLHKRACLGIVGKTPVPSGDG